jgi:hypothetical protein
MRVNRAISFWVLLLGAAVGCTVDSATPLGGPVLQVALAVTPATATIAKGTVQQFMATGTYSDGTTRDLTSKVTWTSNANSVAMVIPTTGKTTGVGPGVVVISAAIARFEARATLTVTGTTLASISVGPSGASAAPGTTTQFMALARFADGSTQEVTGQATWSTDSAAVASVDGQGRVSALAPGTVNVSAAFQGKTGSAPLTVVAPATLTGVEVSPPVAIIAKGTTTSLRATARFSDGKTQDLTGQATWSASPTSVATVDDHGVVSGVAGGMATISAAFQGKSDSAAVTVTEAKLLSIALTPAGSTITRGSTRQFTATGTFSQGATQDLTTQVTWAADPVTVASVSNAAGSKGLATGLATGSASIGVLYQGVAATTTLNVSSPNPALTSLSPTRGPASGGTTVTIAGSGLQGATGVRFGNVPARSVTVESDTELTAVSPFGTGASSVSVTTPIGTSGVLTFTFVPAPQLVSLAPGSGVQAGGTPVTLTGTGFSDATEVRFGSTPATAVVVVSDTEVTAISPAGTGGVNVTVGGPNGTSGAVPFAYGTAPTVGGLQPRSGGQGGGTAVVITGTGFTDAAAVRFGATPALSFTVISDTLINAVSPPGMGGVNVAVTTGNGLSNGSVFNYRTAPSAQVVNPDAGPQGGGNTVLISGAGFEGASAVRFGGTAALAFTVSSDTLITAVAPPGTGSQPVTVTSALGASAGIPYTFGPLPTLTSLSPASGVIGGGLTVTLAGTSLNRALSVWFESTSVPFTINSDLSIAVVAPPGTGSANVKVINLFGESNSLPFSYGPAPAVSSLSPTSGPEFTGTTVVLTGTALTGATAVTFGAQPASYTVDSDTHITASAPAATGPVLVTVTTPFATSNSVLYTHLAPPTITSFAPVSGPFLGGTSVSLTGTGFTGATMVAFGGSASATFMVVSPTLIIASSPAGTATSPIIVTTPNGTGMSSTLFTFIPAPALTATLPTTGPEAGGNTVQITGTNLGAATGVTFGGVTASFTVSNDGLIVATAPVGSGPAPVVVTTPSGVSPSVTYTYVPAPTISALTPSAGPETGGTMVTINGTAMGNLTDVKFGNTSVAFTQVSATQVTTITQAFMGTKAVTVTNGYGTSNSLPFAFGPVPVLTALSRSVGLTGGGQSVTITGSDLLNASTVSFGAAAGTGVVIVSATHIDVTTPAGSGTQNVTVTTPFGVSNGIPFTYGDAPVVTSLSRSAGTDAGGDALVITGSHFSGADQVAFGGTVLLAGFTVVNDATINVTTPAGSGAVDVTVHSAFGTSAMSSASAYLYGPSAVLTSLTPNKGNHGGGTVVVIAGNHLASVTAVSFGVLPAATFHVDSDIQISALAPAGSDGMVTVGVASPYGAGPGLGYLYGSTPTITSVTPSTGPAAGGTSAILVGTSFDFATSVTVGGAMATAMVDSGTQISIITPAGTGSAILTVNTPFGAASSAFTYVPSPALTSLSPSSGPLGGTVLTANGTNLSGASIVKFGSTPASPTGSTATTVTVTAPAAAAGSVMVSVVTTGGESNALPFTYVDVPALMSASPMIGVTAGNTTVTLTGTGLSTTTGVTFGGSAGSSLMIGSDTSISVATPAHAAGMVDVVVTTVGGTATLTNGYFYGSAPMITSLSPNPGSAAGNQLVTITGSDFNGATLVTFGGASQVFTPVSNTSITFTTPASPASPSAVVVTTPFGVSNSASWTSMPACLASGQACTSDNQCCSSTCDPGCRLCD